MVKTRDMLVPAGRRFVNSGTNDRKFITVHDTGNTQKGADANAHARLQQSGNSREASWHWQVDDKEAIRSYEATARCWHAGDGSGPGNNSSEAIEICINSDGDYQQAVKNAAELVAMRMVALNVPISRVVQHNRWSGKNCPAQIRRGRDGIDWPKFLKMVQDASSSEEGKSPTPPSPGVSKTVSQLADEVIAGKHGNGADRRKSLGSRYAEVQAEVNRKLGAVSKNPQPSKSVSQLAEEVIAGKHGNGDARKKSLGSKYAAVQAEVNRKLGAPKKTSKSVSQLATEVIKGMHGNGDARKRALGSQYAAVQAEVNKRLK